MRTWTVITVAVALLILGMPAVVAQGGDGGASIDGEEPEDSDNNTAEEEQDAADDGTERKVELERGEYTVEIKSGVESEQDGVEAEDEFKIEFSVEEEPEIKVERESEIESSDRDAENESEYKVSFEELTGVDGNDTAVGSAYSLEEASFEPLSYTTHNEDDTPVHEITATTTDGVFGVTLYASGDFAEVGGESISPESVKIDIMIEEYGTDQPYTGLETQIESETEMERDGDTIKQTADSGQPAYFSWQDTATVDGEETAVWTTTLESSPTEEEFRFLYESGDSIVHDPKFGVDDASGGGTSFISSIIQKLLAFFSLN